MAVITSFGDIWKDEYIPPGSQADVRQYRREYIQTLFRQWILYARRQSVIVG